MEASNTVNLTLSVSFKSVYNSFAQIYSWLNVENNAGGLSGWFLESRFTVQ